MELLFILFYEQNQRSNIWTDRTSTFTASQTNALSAL